MIIQKHLKNLKIYLYNNWQFEIKLHYHHNMFQKSCLNQMIQFNFHLKIHQMHMVVNIQYLKFLIVLNDPFP